MQKQGGGSCGGALSSCGIPPMTGGGCGCTMPKILGGKRRRTTRRKQTRKGRKANRKGRKSTRRH